MKRKGRKGFCLTIEPVDIQVRCPICGQTLLQTSDPVVPFSSLVRHSIYFVGICFQCPDQNGNRGRYRILRYKDIDPTIYNHVPLPLPVIGTAAPEPAPLSETEILAQLKSGKVEGV